MMGRARLTCGVLAVGVAMLALATPGWPGTTGKISGRVVDSRKQPLPGVTVALPALHLGAITDPDGRYTILQVPPGAWDLKLSLMSYRPVTLTGIQVSADNTATADAEMTEAPIAMPELVVSAKRPVVDLKLTSRLASVPSTEIAKLPVQDLTDIVNLQAGVVDGHFLGGRLGEVQYQVDGVSVNNPYNNSNSLQIDRSLIEEVQVVSGTFDAEYGQAMSGVVNAVLKRGTEQFRWNAEVFDGAYVFPGSQRIVEYELHPFGLQNYQASATGPMPFPKTTYVLDVRHYTSEDPYYGHRVYTPWFRTPTSDKTQNPDGDGSQVPLGWSYQWSGLGKVSNRSIRNLELSYQAVVNWIDQVNTNWAYRFDPDGEPLTETRSIVHGLDATQTLSKNSFVSASLRQNYFTYQSMKYDNLYDSRYDQAGPPTTDPNQLPEPGAIVEGVDLGRFSQTTNALVFKSTYTSQLSHDQQIKLGIEYQWPIVEFGNPGTLQYVQTGSGNQLVRHVNEPPNFPGVQEYRPYITNAYGQDELEWNDLHIRAGARFEYFNPRATVPSDLSNPANSISDVPQSHPVATTRKITLAPRIGISYPVTRKSAVYFAYGHFYQMPELGQIYGNSDYAVLDNLQAGGITYGVLGNPDVKPELTVQYQFGYKQSITDDFGVDVSMFYKDIRDLLGVEFIDLYNGATYARLTNVDFGNVLGATISVSRRDAWLTTRLDYTWQLAQGNSSDPYETATRAQAGEDPRPRTVPFAWDQRHTLNLSATVGHPGVYSASAILRAVSGQPYTPALAASPSTGLETNSGRKPGAAVVDLRGERTLPIGSPSMTLFGRVFNLFDQRFVSGPVFSTSGSPYYSRFPIADEVALADPTRYFTPRRIEIGLTLGPGGPAR